MTDFDDLLAKAEAASDGPWRTFRNRHTTTDGFDWGWVAPSANSRSTINGLSIVWERPEGEANARFLAAASPDVIRALVLRLREAEADYRAVRADLKAAEAVIKDIQWYVPPLGVDDWQHITEHLYAKAAAYFDTTEGGE